MKTSKKEKGTLDSKDIRETLIDYALNLDSETLRKLGGKREYDAIAEYVLEIGEDVFDIDANTVDVGELAEGIRKAMKKSQIRKRKPRGG